MSLKCNIKSKVLFVEESAESDSFAENGLFYKVLRKVLGNTEDFYYTDLKYLDSAMDCINPTCIITLGAKPMEFLTEKVGITSKRGKIFKYKNNKNILVVPTYSPEYVNYRLTTNKIALEQFAKDINKGIAASNGIFEQEREFTKLKICKTMDDVLTLIEHIQTVGQVCLDFETEGLDYKVHRPTVLGASFQIGSGWVVPLYHFDTPFSDVQIHRILELFRDEVWEHAEIRKIGHNFKFDLHFANHYTVGGITPVNFEDTIVMHHILDENVSHALKNIGPTYYPELEGYEDEVKEYKWAEVPLDILSKYCVIDTDLTLRIALAMEIELMESPELYRLYRNLGTPTLQWTFEAEKEGMLIDRDYLVGSIKIVTDLIAEKETQIRGMSEVKLFDKYKRESYDAAIIADLTAKIEKSVLKKNGDKKASTLKYEERLRNIKIGNRDKDSFIEVNFGSPKQLGELIYGEHGFNYKMPYVKEKRMEAPSTNKDYLGELDDHSGFIANLQEWRRMSKLLSTYFVGILDRLDTNNRLHTDFLVHGTTTGRMSSKNPNLQNIPRKGNDSISQIAARVKNCFKAPEGYVVMQADYSQAELRLVAEYAKEDTMIEAYANDKDLHSLTAYTIKRMTEQDFNNLEPAERGDERFKAKAANFGLIYDMQADSYQEYKKFQYKIDSSYADCVKERHMFFKLYSKLLPWHKRMKSLGAKQGYVTTLFGRRRRLLEITNPDDYIRSMSERNAINAPIQGTGGEYTTFSGAILSLRLKVLDTRIKVVNTVHDSIIFYIPLDILDLAKDLIKDTMENPPVKEYFNFELQYVDMKVDCEIGDSWGTLEEE